MAKLRLLIVLIAVSFSLVELRRGKKHKRATTVECKDSNKDCPFWATSGECSKNPAYMKKNCKFSCAVCKAETTKQGKGTKKVTELKVVVNDDINHMFCGLRLKARVVGGTDAASGDWPWQVGIAKTVTPGKPFCGGSLLNKQWVVTASHCFGSAGSTFIQPKDIVIRLAEHDLAKINGNEIVSKVSMIIRHENYGYGSYDNDITLIKLEKPVKYNQLIKPICLPALRKPAKEGTMCYVTGWGRVGEFKAQAQVLQEAKIPIVKRETCKSVLTPFDKFTENMFCGGYSKGGIDACQGDSGGPLVCDNGGRFELVGVVSWGRGCARANSYGFYTRVSSYIDWIKKNIKK